VIYATPNQGQAPVWSPLGNSLAFIESNGNEHTVVKILDIASNRTVAIAPPAGLAFDVNDGAYADLAWLPDGRHLLVLYHKAHTDRRQIGILGLARSDFHTVTNDVNSYSQLALSADGKTLATVLTNLDSSVAFFKGEGGKILSSTPLRITPSELAWADEEHLLLITPNTGISKLERATGTLQSIATGDLDTFEFIQTCPDGHVVFSAVPRGGGEARLFRMDADGSGVTQITTTGIARAPFCSSDSQKVYFTRRDPVSITVLSLWSVPISGGAPSQELAEGGWGSIAVSRDTRLAAVRINHPDAVAFTNIWDLADRRVIRKVPLDVSSPEFAQQVFSPDGKALVEGVFSKAGSALRYQPLDGSAGHMLTEPTQDIMTHFAYSPSGSALALLQLRKSSDVVLVTDLNGRQQQ
jgi:eukaryotic-like serine/threonine-protein kinase